MISKCRSQQSGSVEGNINIIKSSLKPLSRLNFMPNSNYKINSREKDERYF